MTPRSEAEILRLLRFLPGDEATEALYTRAMVRLNLTTVDYTTVRDLCRLSGYSDLLVDTLLICMFLVLQEGSAGLRLEPSAVRRRLVQFIESDVEALVGQVLQAVHSGALERLIAESMGGFGPSESVPFRPLVRAGSPGDAAYLYFHRHYRDVHLLQERIEERLQYSPAKAGFSEADMGHAVAEVLRDFPVRRGGRSMELSAEQQLAVGLGLHRNLVLISGGPGTGKTAICTALLRCLIRLGVPVEKMLLSAPTGRAAQRLSESLRRDLASLTNPPAADLALQALQGATLHRLLEFEPYRNRFRRHRHHPLQAEVLIVDEVSMVDIELMAAVLDATPLDTRLFLIGDPRQLPPVEVGDVLADLLPHDQPPVLSPGLRATLEKVFHLPPGLVIGPQGRGLLIDRVASLSCNYRSTPSLVSAAAAVAAGDTAAVAAWPHWVAPSSSTGPARSGFDPGVYRIDPDRTGTPDWPVLVERWAEAVWLAAPAVLELPDAPSTAARRVATPGYFALVDRLDRFTLEQTGTAVWNETASALFQCLDAARILTLVRRGPFGSENLNRFLVALCKRRRGIPREATDFAGLPLMILQNDAAIELYNGDVGVRLQSRDGSPYVLFPPARDGFRLIAEAALPAATPAFAMTVHKSQGSEYDRVLIALPRDASHRMLRRELLYTALTRARHTVVVYGSDAVLQAAMAQSEPRESGLRWWYNAGFH